MRCTGRSLMPYLYNSSFDISSRVVFKDKATEIFQRRLSRIPSLGCFLSLTIPIIAVQKLS